MASIPSWIAAPEIWDTVILGGQALPGLATIEVTRKKKVDIKRAPGAFSSTETQQGQEPHDVSIAFRMWTPDQWAAWQTILPSIDPQGGKKPTPPLTLIHPKSALMGVKAVTLLEVTAPKNLGKQIFQIDIKAVEWAPPPKKTATSTPKSAASVPNALTGGAAKGDSANDAASKSNVKQDVQQQASDVYGALGLSPPPSPPDPSGAPPTP